MAIASDPPNDHGSDSGADETLRVLLIEDNDIVRTLTVKMLQADGHEVVAVGSAEDALALGPDVAVDLVFTDLVLPGLNGYELLERLLERRPGLRVLITSGYAAPETLPPIPGARGVEFLAKPYSQAELHDAVARLR